MTDQQKEIIMALAECNMKISTASKKLFYSPGALIFRMGKIKRETGLDAREAIKCLKNM